MPRFFGLTSNDKEIYLEPIFLLMYYLGFTYKDAYHLPVYQRYWFIKRLNKELKQSSDGESPQGSRAHQDNTAQTRSLMGRHREQTPARLRRFT